MTDLAPLVADLESRLEAARALAETEEATKTAIVMPFLRMLGYDVFDPREVVPEFTADVGIKKGEKIDYAVKIGDRIAMLVEAKALNKDLAKSHHSQLYRYFAATDASVALLTNGRRFHFFTDIDAANRLDERPFFIFDLENHSEADIQELARFRKSDFDIERIRATAARMRHVALATAWLRRQAEDPEDEFVKLVARSFHDGNLTARVLDELRPTVKAAFAQLVRERIERKLRLAFEGPAEESAPAEAEAEPDGIETTEAELQGFYIVKAIAASQVDPARITLRDAKSYCAVLFDDNNRKPVCRLHFNGKRQWYLGLFDEAKQETRHPLDRLDGIYAHAEALHAALSRYAD